MIHPKNLSKYLIKQLIRFDGQKKAQNQKSATWNLFKWVNGVFIEKLSINQTGTVTLYGVRTGERSSEETSPAFYLDVAAGPVFSSSYFLINRPEIHHIFTKEHPHCCFVMEFHLPETFGAGANIPLCHQDKTFTSFKVPFDLVAAPYADLFKTESVYHRDNIYGYGPPTHEPPEEVLDLVKQVPSPLLDFGCGSGALVHRLRHQGVEAFGIEMDRPEIHAELLEEAKPYVQIYDGVLPLPYEDQSF